MNLTPWGHLANQGAQRFGVRETRFGYPPTQVAINTIATIAIVCFGVPWGVCCWCATLNPVDV